MKSLLNRRPITHEGRRYRALNSFHPSDALLLRALSRGEWTMGGLRHRDLQRLLYTCEPRDKKAARRRRTQTAFAARHGLLRKLPHTHRNLVTGRSTSQQGS
jgi:hypothetical protein